MATVDELEKKRAQNAQGQFGLQGGLAQTVSGLEKGAGIFSDLVSKATKGYDDLRNQGYGVFPAGVMQARKNVIDPISKAASDLGGEVGSVSERGYKTLFGTPQDVNKVDSSSKINAPTPIVAEILDKPIASKIADKGQPKAETGIYSYNPKAKNIFGESVQALDEQGGYRVGAGKNSATVIPWSPSDYDALARTLPAEQYNQLAAQKRSMEDQRATAIVPESSEESFERTKRGSSESSRTSRGGFNPDANEISGAYAGSTTEDAAAKAEVEFLKNQQVQEQKQRVARLWADATNPDSSEEKRNDAFSVLQKIDPDAFAKYIRSNAAL